MPEFKKKAQRFLHRGQNWNSPVDTIPDGQICYGRNVRVTQQGTITQRPGLTLFQNLSGTYINSIARLNNFNTGLIAFTKLYIIGMDSKLYVGETGADLAGASNPVALPPTGSTATLSNNPMTMVDMAPVGTNVGWKYIGDSSQNFSVGKYPADATAAMARALTMGMTPPVNTTIPTAVGAPGLLDGDYQWRFAYRNQYTGA